jgi:DNA polymerase-3 subunit alpha
MKPENFVHLHVHSHFSLLDGACTVTTLAKLAKQHQMKSLAITDHGNLFGVIQFHKAMTGEGVKPILGYEAYVAPGSRKDRVASAGGKDSNHHLTLLATDLRGYHNLVRLSSIAYLEGFYYKPRIDQEVLAQHKDGLIALSGCNSSEVCHHLLAGRHAAARDAAGRYVDIFGKENYFIEVQDNGLEDQKACLEGLVKVAGEAGLKMVATNDIHYATPEDARAHEVLLCINTGKQMTSEDRMSFGSNEFYFKSAEEMAKRFAQFPGAVENTGAIAERCNVDLDWKARHFPRYEPPDGMTGAEFLLKVCLEGMRARYGEKPEKSVRDRLDYELTVIDKMGYSSYFLIVWDIIHFARQHRIPAGLRGSGASALVCYVLGISDVDPLAYSLIFERFLDPQRREPPDLDLDLCEVRREEVIRYLRDKYGHDHTAQIITFGTMKAKAVVKDVGRALGWPLPEVNALAKLIPNALGTTLKSAYEAEETLRKDRQNNPKVKELLGYAERIEGLNRHASTHAAGVCIADRPLVEHIPICKINDIVMTQFAMNDLEKAGMLKMDLLGLRTLTIVDGTIDLVEKRTGKRIDMDAIPLDDAKTYELIGRGDTKAVFQLGSSGIQDLLRRLKPKDMADIIAVVAMYRPGPLQSGMVDDYIARRHGEKEVTYVDKRLEPILKDTCGVIVYQEQIMQILHDLGGLTLADALSTIKAISKKRVEEIDKRAGDFFKGAKAKGIKESVSKELFELIRHFAQYGFNRAHATAYAFLAYKTAYLKANYPMEFAAADLTCEMGHSDKLKEHIRDCTQLGIKVLPPDVNEGDARFTVTPDNAIRFGMSGVKNVGDKAVEAVLAARNEGGAFTSLYNFCERVPGGAINRQALETLVKAGAFDNTPGSRAQKVAVLEEAMKMGVRAQRDRRKGQKSLFGDAGPTGESIEPALPAVKEWTPAEMSRYEKDALGLRLSFNPMERFELLISQLATATATTVGEKNHDEVVIVAGEVIDVRPTITKQGRSMAHLELEDLTGSLRAVVFPDYYEKYAALLKEDAVLFVIASVDRSGERAGIQLRDVVPVANAAARLTERVRLTLQRTAMDDALLEKMQNLLSRHPGDRPVYLDIVTPDKKTMVMRVGREFHVRPGEEFIADVERLLGPGHLTLTPRVPTLQSLLIARRGGYGNGRSNGG